MDAPIARGANDRIAETGADMNAHRRDLALLGAIIVAAGAAASGANAQGYPEHTIEIVVGFAPGGVTDVLGRALARGISSHLLQTVIISNKPGASGGLGAAAVARSKPDGYALFYGGAATMAPYPAQTGYNRASFEPICQAYKFDLVIIVRPDSPLKSMTDLVNLARSNPGGVTYGHLGAGSSFHLTMIALSQAAGIELNPIPFRGDSETMQQVLGGQVDFGIVTLSSAAGGSHRMLGVFADARNPSYPDVPTVGEQGLHVTDVASMAVGGLFAPTGLPPEVKRKLAEACAVAAQGDDYQRVAKSLHQPEGFYADTENFIRNVDKAVEVKTRLLITLGAFN